MSLGSAPRLSIVVPVLDEAGEIRACLQALQPLRERGHEVIVVDGGSRDGSATQARALADRVLVAPTAGRAAQMNAGAGAAAGDALVFLHVDTRLPPGADRMVQDALSRAPWGRFDVAIGGRHPVLRLVAAMMNLRSRVTAIATGDQAVFVRRATFEATGGYAALPLMEDIELSCRLRDIARPACISAKAVTSGRRWESRGVWRTIVLMWRLRLEYFLGVDPSRLVERYR
jgi:rSAM/selenodomain-associated transferase 2